MAPVPPPRASATTLRHQRISGQIHPLLPSKIFRPSAAVTYSFLSNKRDKRLIKHSSFVSKISTARVGKTLRRRRPSKKLKTSLEGLADALPELAEGEDGQQELAGKIKHRSLKSRKGALKRKERVVKGEMERFGASMARLTAAQQGQTPVVSQQQQQDDEDDDDDEHEMEDVDRNVAAKPVAAPSPATTNRWAALRGYISATMEQNPAFTGKK